MFLINFIECFWYPTKLHIVTTVSWFWSDHQTSLLSTFPNFDSLIHRASHYVGLWTMEIWNRKLAFISCVSWPWYMTDVFSPIEVVKWLWASNVLWHLLWTMSHTRRDLSSDADSRYLPPGCQVIPDTYQH